VTPPSLLFDENLPRVLQTALSRERPRVRQARVGSKDGPPIGASDQEVLQFAERDEWLLVSRDRRSMLGEVDRHVAAGGHTWGVLLVRPATPLRRLVDDLVLVVDATDREEWRDVLAWIPFGH
jgi:hypothetical protein